MNKKLNMDPALSESEALAKLKGIMSKNKVLKSFIGMGYYETLTPGVILRNVLENPGWYTAYTPYQAEIAQGRMEALLNFQTIILDLTQMEIANASLLDEATAVAEAVHLLNAVKKGEKQKANKIYVSDKCHPQTLELVQLRSEPIGIEVVIGDIFKVILLNTLFKKEKIPIKKLYVNHVKIKYLYVYNYESKLK